MKKNNLYLDLIALGMPLVAFLLAFAVPQKVKENISLGGQAGAQCFTGVPHPMDPIIADDIRERKCNNEELEIV